MSNTPKFDMTARARRRIGSPENMKKRIANGDTNFHRRAYVQLGKTNTRILTGEEDLSIWSDEELIRGRRRNKSGNWTGKDPKVVPKAIHDELVRRTMKKASELMRDNLVKAVEVLTSLIKDPDVEARDKIKAIEMVMNRVMGKTPEVVELSAELKPWQAMVADAIVPTTEPLLLPAEADDDDDKDEEE